MNFAKALTSTFFAALLWVNVSKTFMFSSKKKKNSRYTNTVNKSKLWLTKEANEGACLHSAVNCDSTWITQMTEILDFCLVVVVRFPTVCSYLSRLA